jgi:hypothetical protein
MIVESLRNCTRTQWWSFLEGAITRRVMGFDRLNPDVTRTLIEMGLWDTASGK